VKADPASIDARIRLSEALFQQGQLDEAASQLVQGLSSDPYSSEAYLAHYYLSRIYQQKGMPEEADREGQKAVELNPGLGGTPLGASALKLVVPEQEKKR
jgi:Tfp pilus assembly protein PilF